MFRLGLGVFLMFFGDVGSGYADAASAPTGRWMTANHEAVIQIAPCGQDMCGQIVGLAQQGAGPKATDWQGRPQCGEIIMQTAASTDGSGNTVWRGVVLDPRNGNTYQASVAVDGNRQLRLHGYIGLPIFGQTQVWAPYSGRTLANCQLASVYAAAQG